MKQPHSLWSGTCTPGRPVGKTPAQRQNSFRERKQKEAEINFWRKTQSRKAEMCLCMACSSLSFCYSAVRFLNLEGFCCPHLVAVSTHGERPQNNDPERFTGQVLFQVRAACHAHFMQLPLWLDPQGTKRRESSQGLYECEIIICKILQAGRCFC